MRGAPRMAYHAGSDGAQRLARVNSGKSSTYRTNVERRIIGVKVAAAADGNRSPTAAPGAPAVRRLQVDAESAGQRLDNFLLRILKGVPKTHVYRVIRSGEVRLNKGRAQAPHRRGDECACRRCDCLTGRAHHGTGARVSDPVRGRTTAGD
jgi:hypothetical protein